MERIFPQRSLPTTATIPFRLPPYFLPIVYLLIGVTIIVIGVILTARREIADPFSVFSDLFGPDARQAAQALGFKCRNIALHSRPHDSCTQNSTNDTFSGVFLRLSDNVTSEISFWLQQDTLTLGHLVLLWGEPEIRLYCETVVAFWPGRDAVGFTTPSQTAHIRYSMPVLFVTFTHDGLADWENMWMNTATLTCGSVRVGSLGP